MKINYQKAYSAWECSTDFYVICFFAYMPAKKFYRFFGKEIAYLSASLEKIGRTKKSVELFFTEKVSAFSVIAEKIINFFRQCPHRGDITLATINIRNSGERG